jgi:lysophospholipase L1-like esterase
MFKKYFIPLLITLSFLILLYSLYQSEIIYNGKKRNFYLFYIISCLVVIFIGITLFFLNNQITVVFFIIFTSSILTAYSFEFYLNYLSISRVDDLNIKKKSEILKKRTGEKYDTRSKYSYFLSKKKTNPNIKIDINTANLLEFDNLEILPVSGYSNSEIIMCNEFGYYKHINTDRYGFNNNDRIWDSNNIDYVIIGDSFIEGYCQDEKNTIPQKLSSMFQGNLINLGQGGAGSLQQYATILEYMPDVKKGLVWFICDNDIIDLQKELQNPQLFEYLIKNYNYQNLKLRQNDVDKTFNYVFEYKEKLRKKNQLKMFFKLNFIRSYFHSFVFKNKTNSKIAVKYNEERFRHFYKILENLKNFSIEKKFDLYVVYLPTYNYYKDNKYLNKDYRYIINILDKLNIAYLDINEQIFKKEKNPKDLFPFGFYGHYNNYGSKIISKAVYEFVDKSTLN